MRGTWATAAVATMASAAFLCALVALDSHDLALSLVSNVGELVAALLASAGCAIASQRRRGREQRAWRWLSAGTGCWAAGQAVWTYYEDVLGQEVPFPSFADVGFLAFPLVAGVGLVIWSGTQSHEVMARGRDLMDGAIIATSLLVLSWVLVMAPVVEAGGGASFSVALSLAYPAGDVILAALVMMALVRATTDRATLALMALGLWVFALADSAFSYLTSKGTFSSADLVSNGGWVFGLLLVAAAGTSVTHADDASRVGERETVTRSSLFWHTLPYVPVLAVGVALFVDLLTSEGSPLVDLLLAVAVVVMVLGRQFLAVADNHRLLRALVVAGDQLEHLATHDALTGLPNRTLFGQRLDQALLTGSSTVSVLFCDLDNFKPVNDELGHDAGDQLLKVVSERLLGCVRATDTVARLGGDEFAILLENCTEPLKVAEEVVASMDRETSIEGQRVRTSISVGLAHHPGITLRAAARTRPEDVNIALQRRSRPSATGDTPDAVRDDTAARLVQLADTAMYTAKSSGKGRVAVLELDPISA